MFYPDPFNAIEFEAFIDQRPHHRMSRAQIRDETEHWAGWVQTHGLLGREPQARRATAIQAGGATASGIVLGLLGPIGFGSSFLGNLISTAGFVATVWALFISARLRLEQAAPTAAAERVENRLADLAARRAHLAQPGQ